MDTQRIILCVECQRKVHRHEECCADVREIVYGCNLCLETYATVGEADACCVRLVAPPLVLTDEHRAGRAVQSKIVPRPDDVAFTDRRVLA